MEQKENLKDNKNILTEFLLLIRRYIFLILAIIILATGLGVGYSYIRKPTYTASMRVSFSIDGNSSATITEIRQYVDTIVDFCDEGVVIDRANAYYIEWVDSYKEIDKDVKLFYDRFKSVINPETTDYNEIFSRYKRPTTGEQGTLKDETFIVSDAIHTKTLKFDNSTNWVFDIQYTDAKKQEAIDKAYILVLAYKHELYSDKNTEQYFTNLNVAIDNLGFDGVSQDMSKTKIVAMAFIIGVVLAVAFVYLITLMDKTIKDKNELSEITGAQVIGCIELSAEGKNGK